MKSNSSDSDSKKRYRKNKGSSRSKDKYQNKSFNYGFGEDQNLNFAHGESGQSGYFDRDQLGGTFNQNDYGEYSRRRSDDSNKKYKSSSS